MVTSKTVPVLGSIAAMALVVVGVGVGVQQFGPTREHPIVGSYYFDVTERTQLAGFSDAVIVATVTSVLSTNKEAQTTRFVVEPTRWFKGETPPTITIDQMGFTSGRDVFFPEDQVVLEEGGTFLIVIREKREERGVYGVVGGPASVTPVNEEASGTLDANKPSEAPIAEIERVWTDAVLHQEYPPSAPRD